MTHTTTPATSPTTPASTGTAVALGDRIAALAVTIRHSLLDIADGQMSNDRCAEIHDARLTIKRLVRELDAEAEEAFVTRLKAHGDIDMGGGRRLYAAPNKTTRSIDNKLTMEVLIESCGGDLDIVVGCLSAQPFKHGLCAKIMGHGNCFETVVTSRVKEGSKKGKALDRVQISDDNQRR